MNSAYRGLAAVYDRFMADVDYDGWAAYILDRVRAEMPGVARPRVVECGCGTGAVTWRLLNGGLEVTGLDLSDDMLRMAREKLRSAGFATTPLVSADMRAFSVHRPVDAVIAACDGVNYLSGDDDAARFFSAARRALRPGGLLLFDISSAYKLRNILDGRTFGEDLAECAYLWQNVYDEDSGLLQMDLSIFTREADGRYARVEETHWQRAYETEELSRLLRDNGFERIEAFDAFTTDAPRCDSERIQFLARRGTDG